VRYSPRVHPFLPKPACLLLLCATSAAFAGDHGGHGRVIPGSEREFFNRSPFHRADIVAGVTEQSLPITTRSSVTQEFFDQGLALFLAGWPQEAERSFLTAQQSDEDAAMPRWGIALSRLVRDPSAALPALIQLAARREAVDQLPRWERQMIASLPSVAELESDSDWRPALVKRLRQAIVEKPSRHETKTILASLLADGLHAWRDDCGETRDSTFALIRDTATAMPADPVQRLGLRLWANELRHDPYHTPKEYFDRETLKLSAAFPTHWNLLGRYLAERGQYPAAFQHSEMASRIYHHWSALRKCPPDLLPDYARHRMTQAEQLRATGNVAPALAIAHELLRLPRHPVWNAATNGFGSAFAGRKLLVESCLFFGLWDELATALNDGRLAPLPSPLQRAEHAFIRGVTAWFRQQTPAFESAAKELETISRSAESQFLTQPAPDDYDAHHGSMLQWLRDGGEDFLAVTDWNRCLQALRESDRGNAEVAALWLSGSRRVPSLLRARLLWRIGRRREAGQALLNAAELALPLRVKAMEVAKQGEELFPVRFEINRERPQPTPAKDDLSQLGLSSWQPLAFPAVKLPLLDGSVVDESSFRGRHTVLIFVYSSNCAHCVDQLNALRQATDALRAADLNAVVIAGQSAGSLSAWLETQEPFPARFAADPDEKWFHTVGAYDDFNEMPLHATIYIDPAGRELWKDVGYEPFMDISFLIAETIRLRAAYPNTGGRLAYFPRTATRRQQL